MSVLGEVWRCGKYVGTASGGCEFMANDMARHIVDEERGGW